MTRHIIVVRAQDERGQVATRNVVINVVTADPYWAQVASLLSMRKVHSGDGLFDEQFKTWDLIGDARLTSAFTWFDEPSSLFLDGNGDYCSTSSIPGFNPGTESFTSEVLVRPLAVPVSSASAHRYILAMSSTGYTNGWIIGIRWSPVYAHAVAFMQWGFSSGTEHRYEGSIPIEVGGNYHLAAVREGTASRLYVNGVLDASGPVRASLPSVSNPLYLGHDRLTPGRNFHGYVGSARITKGVARYNSNFDPPSEPWPRL